jgi:hypothetical protein
MTYAFAKHLYGTTVLDTAMNGIEYAPHTDPHWDPFSIMHNVSLAHRRKESSRTKYDATDDIVSSRSTGHFELDCGLHRSGRLRGFGCHGGTNMTNTLIWSEVRYCIVGKRLCLDVSRCNSHTKPSTISNNM